MKDERFEMRISGELKAALKKQAKKENIKLSELMEKSAIEYLNKAY